LKRHNERCRECKKRIAELLLKIYGEARINHNLQLSNRPEAFKNTPYHEPLQRVFESLQKHRGHEEFVRARKLPNVDFFVPSLGLILEFDESQHFTAPREITLCNYPDQIELGFDRNRWIRLCQKLHRRDNDPPYRDEQRAWYDTIRDFAPHILGLKPTVRLFAEDMVWCSLNPDSTDDTNTFKRYTEARKNRSI
jgi:hypothetical protein